MKRFLPILLIVSACSTPAPDQASTTYFDQSGRQDVLAGGSRLIPVETPSGTFNVWTKRVGNNPTIKLLLLHGGPGMTSEYFEAFDSYFPGAGIEYYYYDQLGSFRADQPDDDALWQIPRFVEEVEQVRRALGLGPDNFYLLGHSWGGILAMEYALKYQENLKGLVISNMMASGPAYDAYAQNVLGPKLDPDVLIEIQALESAGDFANPRYEQLLTEHYYVEHVIRMTPDQWPDPMLRSFKHVNGHIYQLMQGPSEFGLGGRLETWDRSGDIAQIRVPTLVIGAEHDTMDPAHMEWMAGEVQHGRYLYCPDGSHMAMFDDQETYVNGVIRFLKDVDSGSF